MHTASQQNHSLSQIFQKGNLIDKEKKVLSNKPKGKVSVFIFIIYKEMGTLM